MKLSQSITTSQSVINDIAAFVADRVPAPSSKTTTSSSSKSISILEQGVTVSSLPPLPSPDNILNLHTDLQGVYQRFVTQHASNNDTTSRIFRNRFTMLFGIPGLRGPSYTLEEDDNKETWVEGILLAICEPLLYLVKLEIIGLWDSETGDGLAGYARALEILKLLEIRSQEIEGRTKPDIRLIYDRQTLSCVDAKPTSIGLHLCQKADMTKDEHLSSVIAGGKLYSTSASGGKGGTMCLPAQMYDYALKAESKICFFTSVLGFSRMGRATTTGFQMSGNITPSFTNTITTRRSPDTYLPLVEALRIFFFHSIIKHLPDVLPPSKRPLFQPLPPPHSPPILHTISVFLKMNISHIIFRMNPSLFAYTTGFTVVSIPGRFRNIGASPVLGSIVPRRLEPTFDIPQPVCNRHTSIRIDRQLGIVVKGFGHDEVSYKRFLQERQAYEKLSASLVSGVPTYHGAFQNTFTGANYLITEYIGEALNRDLSINEEAQLAELLSRLHEVGVHHHDIHPSNVVKKNGEIFVIDFDLADLNCSGKTWTCADYDWM